VTTILGLDLGERRIGVAIAEVGGLAARPLVTLPRGRDIGVDAGRLRALVDEHAAIELVVGLPLEAAGQEGPQARITRDWVDAVAAVLERDVAWSFRDERLSSHVAESRLGPMRRGRSGGPPSRHQRDAYRARVDREAAAIILQDALDTRRASDPSLPGPQSTLETPP